MKKLSIVFMVAVLSLFLMAGCSEEKKTTSRQILPLIHHMRNMTDISTDWITEI